MLSLVVGAVDRLITPYYSSAQGRAQFFSCGTCFVKRTNVRFTSREFANAAMFIASDEASFITSSVMTVDDGWTTR